MDGERIAALLQRTEPGAELTTEEALRVAAAGRLRDVDRGADLIVEGDTSSEMFVLLEGAAEVWKTDPAGQQDVKLCDIAAGEAIGELSMLGTSRRVATVRTATPCRVFVLDRPTFEQLVGSGDSAAYKMALQLARVVSQRMMLLHERVMDYLQDAPTRPQEFALFKRELLSNWDF